MPSPTSIILKAKKLQKTAKQVGFNLENANETLVKVYEEFNELKKAIRKDNKKNIIEEFGDLLFSIVNLSRYLGIKSETALKLANNKFERRFEKLQNIIVRTNSIKRPHSIRIIAR